MRDNSTNTASTESQQFAISLALMARWWHGADAPVGPFMIDFHGWPMAVFRADINGETFRCACQMQINSTPDDVARNMRHYFACQLAGRRAGHDGP